MDGPFIGRKRELYRVLEAATKFGKKILSEHEAKKFLSLAGIPATKEFLVTTLDAAQKAAEEIGFPVVLKGASLDLTHKTELDLVKLDIRNGIELRIAFEGIVENPKASCQGVLVQEMVSGERELIVGLARDIQFGPAVMFGIGGIFAEVLKDICFRLAPLNEQTANQMLEDIRMRKMLGPLRGKQGVDRKRLVQILITIGNIGLEFEEIRDIDINPLMIDKAGNPVAVDALIAFS